MMVMMVMIVMVVMVMIVMIIMVDHQLTKSNFPNGEAGHNKDYQES